MESSWQLLESSWQLLEISWRSVITNRSATQATPTPMNWTASMLGWSNSRLSDQNRTRRKINSVTKCRKHMPIFGLDLHYWRCGLAGAWTFADHMQSRITDAAPRSSWRASRAQTYLNFLLKPIEVVDSQEPGLLQSIGRAMIGITATYIWEYPHAPVWISWAYWSCGLATDLTEGLENVKVYTSWGQGLHVLV